MAEIVFLYCTAPDVDVATKIGGTLIEENLAACVNLLGGSTSIYKWKGEVETCPEVPFLVKTTKTIAGKTCARILELHPFDCPCVAALPINDEGSSSPFLDWIKQNTS